MNHRVHHARSRLCAYARPKVNQFTLQHERAAATGPPTVANLGPGFDWLGVAVEGKGDVVEASVVHDDTAASGNSVYVASIIGDSGKLPLSSEDNCAAVAAKHTLQLLGATNMAVSLNIQKGLPLGSGLGSSAASAAAAATAVASLFGCDDAEVLVPAGIEAEACVSGRHADNVAPALMGGFILIQQTSPPRVRRLQCAASDSLYFVLVTPEQEAPTAQMRQAVPKSVSIPEHVLGAASGGALVAGILSGDISLLGECLASDRIIEPARAPLIPGFLAAKHAAVEAGAAGCTISGAGPTAVAVTDGRQNAERVCKAMADAFGAEGAGVVSASATPLCNDGARSVPLSSAPQASDKVLTIL